MHTGNGWVAKQNESGEICKMCKYRKKSRQLEKDKYEANKIIDSYVEDRKKLIEKLEEKKKILEYAINIVSDYYCRQECKSNLAIVEEILEIVKGEKHECKIKSKKV